MTINFKKYISFFIFFLVFPVLISSAKTEDTSLLLGSAESIETNPLFKKVLESPSAAQEKMKIQYLLSRIRRSPLTFIRNGEPHDGERAAVHVTMKYRKRGEHIQTAREFIDEIASESRNTGRPYLVSIEGQTYPVRDVLYNELRAMEEKIQNGSNTNKNE